MLTLLKRSIYPLFFLWCFILSSSLAYGELSLIYSDNQVGANAEVVCESDYSLPLKKCHKHEKLTYYLNTADFIRSFIQIPTSNVTPDSSTVSSTYLAGRAPVYNLKNEKVGICSASFLCMQNEEGSIFTDIANYLSIDNGLIVTWFTPTTLINLELDTIVHSMVTECIVMASTKVGFNPFYGKQFNMVVSSDQSKIYFKLHKI